MCCVLQASVCAVCCVVCCVLCVVCCVLQASVCAVCWCCAVTCSGCPANAMDVVSGSVGDVVVDDQVHGRDVQASETPATNIRQPQTSVSHKG